MSQTTARGYLPTLLPAELIKEGDRLDRAGKIRVSRDAHPSPTSTLVFVCWKQRGSKAPGASTYEVGEMVRVYRLPEMNPKES